ncbi:MAG TPA: ABC transporter ATP-binding protein [Burkholderiaceae bacterium]|nr:ABC transporter ATP-binding protein [Burkholderiaceae bacterium]
MGAITVNRLGKAYRRYPDRRSRLLEWVMPWRGPRHEATWVVRDVTFRLQPGEAIGIIGGNGAGKSTLLKLIAGTTQPTSGSVSVTGRVAALLELGMGFHPDFTGRQNVVMAGQLLGFTAGEMAALLPDIERFAEIGTYIDQPVRILSSGMQVRLAFAVATAVRPDILIVDEALSVGDAYFQHKSFDRIRQFREAGTSLLIVSHDKTAIQSVCDRALLLEKGELIKDGSPEEVADFYNALIAERGHWSVEQSRASDGRTRTTSGTRAATVECIEILDAHSRRVEVVDVGQPVVLRIVVRVHAALPRLVLGYMVKDRLGQPMFGTNTHLRERPLVDVAAGSAYEYRFEFPANFGPGSYSVTTSLSSTETHLGDNFEWRDLALLFSVANLSRSHFVGCNWLEPVIHVAALDRTAAASGPAPDDSRASATLEEPTAR